ncbi:hypothetical protein [Arthrobacter sp. UYCu712]|uniref:hypothetical protein n=1 Tax=Arthrobacter sp. UYCu712 TaxID=3156340 RepID=UPI00339B362B
MDPLTPPELEGQRSINELLDEPIGDRPIQLELPIPGRPRPAARLPARPRTRQPA